MPTLKNTEARTAAIGCNWLRWKLTVLIHFTNEIKSFTPLLPTNQGLHMTAGMSLVGKSLFNMLANTGPQQAEEASPQMLWSGYLQR